MDMIRVLLSTVFLACMVASATASLRSNMDSGSAASSDADFGLLSTKIPIPVIKINDSLQQVTDSSIQDEGISSVLQTTNDSMDKASQTTDSRRMKSSTSEIPYLSYQEEENEAISALRAYISGLSPMFKSIHLNIPEYSGLFEHHLVCTRLITLRGELRVLLKDPDYNAEKALDSVNKSMNDLSELLEKERMKSIAFNISKGDVCIAPEAINEPQNAVSNVSTSSQNNMDTTQNKIESAMEAVRL